MRLARSRGRNPLRDFFEHHGPALYYLLQPILPDGAGTAGLVVEPATDVGRRHGHLGRDRRDRLSARWEDGRGGSPALLICTTIFFQKAIEVRPDVPAMLLLTLAAYVAIATGNRRSTSAALLAGFLFGLGYVVYAEGDCPCRGTNPR